MTISILINQCPPKTLLRIKLHFYLYRDGYMNCLNLGVSVKQIDDYACLVHRPWESNLNWHKYQPVTENERKQTKNTDPNQHLTIPLDKEAQTYNVTVI